VDEDGHAGLVRWSVLECSGMRLSWAQLGHKPVGFLLDQPVGPLQERLRNRHP